MKTLKNYDGFVNLKLGRETLHNYFIRKSIIGSISKHLALFKGDLLDVGCGSMPYRNYIIENSDINEYVGLDLENALLYSFDIKPDFYWDGEKMPFNEESFSTIICTEVLEHCPEPKALINESFRVLKKSGVFFFTVPFIWNLHEVPNDYYRYTPFALKKLFKDAGFRKVEIFPSGGWNASHSQMLGLYINRAPLGRICRRILQIAFLPIIAFLNKKSEKENVKFKEGQMISALNGYCIK